MEKMKLGAQLYTLRDYMKTANSFCRTMERVAEIGYKYVQVSAAGAEVTPDVIKKACDATGLSVIITHNPLDRILYDTDRLIEEHDKFGCNIIGLGHGGDYLNYFDGFKRFAEDVAPAAEKIKKAGKVFSYHNHFQEFEKCGDKYFIDALLENSDPDAVKITADVYWLHFAGLDESDWLREHADRISCTHFKDMGVHNGKQEIIEVMAGNLNYAKILKACAESGIEYNFAELDTTRIDPFEALKVSYGNLMSTGYFEK